ncbi:class F sortase [Luteimicrobium subarcticum]|uniref:Sortase family protein n=1 Tax=Luteimicrobium subarcticum TaxID=620910 RepID=A0A2M8WRH3_9MICO|nr:class F sortase [Luteimicrobium subarcticum]PJI93518.1 sortase family protein [Luteimicrobium subarcticum]
MSDDDARARDDRGDAARTPGGGRRRAWTVAAVALLVGGATAVAVGLATQTPSPPAPPAAFATDAAPATTPEVSDDPTARPTGAAGGGAAVPAPAKAAAPTARPAAHVARPTQISIPSVGITSPLLTMGLAKDGTIEVSTPGKNYDKAGWYEGSPRPGQDGPAVIEGHVDGPDGRSVFYALGAVKPGAAVHVARADGTTVTFVVDRVASYPKDDFPVETVYRNTKGPELRLITCGGAFDRSTGHFVDNVVVFAHER